MSHFKKSESCALLQVKLCATLSLNTAVFVNRRNDKLFHAGFVPASVTEIEREAIFTQNLSTVPFMKG